MYVSHTHTHTLIFFVFSKLLIIRSLILKRGKKERCVFKLLHYNKLTNVCIHQANKDLAPKKTKAKKAMQIQKSYFSLTEDVRMYVYMTLFNIIMQCNS